MYTVVCHGKFYDMCVKMFRKRYGLLVPNVRKCGDVVAPRCVRLSLNTYQITKKLLAMQFSRLSTPLPRSLVVLDWP